MLKLRDVMSRWEAGGLSQLDAAKLLARGRFGGGAGGLRRKAKTGFWTGAWGGAPAGRFGTPRPRRLSGFTGSATPASRPNTSTSTLSSIMALPKELALAGVKDIEAANAFIREIYLPALERPLRNEAGRRAKAPSRRWRRPNGATSSCIQEERVVAPDNTVAWNGGRLQIPPHPARAHFVRAKIPGPSLPERRTGYLPRTTTIGPMARQSGGRHHSLIAGRVSPLWRPAKAADGMDKADASPTPPTAQQTVKGGHLMCYINRTTSEARYTRAFVSSRRGPSNAASLAGGSA